MTAGRRWRRGFPLLPWASTDPPFLLALPRATVQLIGQKPRAIAAVALETTADRGANFVVYVRWFTIRGRVSGFGGERGV